MSNRYWQEDYDTSFYHLIIKVPDNTAGNSSYPFTSSHKDYLQKLLLYLDSVYLTDVLSYCIMSNHVHIIMAKKNGAEANLSLKDTALAYKNYYRLKESPDARSQEIRKFRTRLNNISDFMRDLQRRFTFWYNNQFSEKRRGSLWNPRFKSVSLTSLKALNECMKYVELNSVRAKLANNPGNYAWCSWSHIVRHDRIGKLLRSKIIKYFRYMIGEKNSLYSDSEIFLRYASDLESLNVKVSENKEVKRVDPYFQEFLLGKCEHWSRLKVIGGEETLRGETHGETRVRTIQFKLE